LDYYSEMLARYRNRGLLVDTSLLLLFLVGVLDPGRIERFKRTKSFTIEDFGVLKRMVLFFTRVVTTPNILTEVSNLLRQLPEGTREESSSVFSKAVDKINEEYTSSRDLAAQNHFPKFGLTDSSIIETCRLRYLVLTVDLPLFAFLTNSGLDAINFNHIRTWTWFADLMKA